MVAKDNNYGWTNWPSDVKSRCSVGIEKKKKDGELSIKYNKKQSINMKMSVYVFWSMNDRLTYHVNYILSLINKNSFSTLSSSRLN